MPVDALLDADTETFETGPYNRAVRVRKWVYLCSGATAIVAQGWFAESDVLDWVGVSAVPSVAIWQATSFALAYFLFQYVLVSIQVISLYRTTLRARLGEKIRGDLRRLELAIDRVRQESLVARDQYHTEAELIRERMEGAEVNNDPNELRLQQTILQNATSSFESAERARKEQYQELELELREASLRDHASNPVLITSEVLLDLWRLLPPLVVGAIVLAQFGRLLEF